MVDLSRRMAIGGALGGAIAAPALAKKTDKAPIQLKPIISAFAGGHVPVALKFDPAKLDGISEKLITSHWANNYTGSVKALNMIEGQIAKALADPDVPALVYGGLKRELLHRTGSVVLHEHYFETFGGNGVAGGSIKTALIESFGSWENWEIDFRRTGMSLAGGSGWCILALNLHLGRLENYWAWDHMSGAAASIPLLTLDMYEHSFQMDYGAAAAKYVDAWFRNVNWEVVDQRFVRARKMHAL
ncbi:MAG: Fe-Mn family superoxide dismutase [Chakrabartia sp.]